MIAAQGPSALEVVQRVFDAPLAAVKYYQCTLGTILGGRALASRTGYTGEDGFELIVPAERAVAVWEALLDAGRDLGIVPLRARGARHLAVRGGHAAVRARAHETDQPLCRRARDGP